MWCPLFSSLVPSLLLTELALGPQFLSLLSLSHNPLLQVSYLPRMCLPYPSLSPAAPSTDEEEGERQSPPLEVSDGEVDGLEQGPGLLHGETGSGGGSSCVLRHDFGQICGPARPSRQGQVAQSLPAVSVDTGVSGVPQHAGEGVDGTHVGCMCMN